MGTPLNRAVIHTLLKGSFYLLGYFALYGHLSVCSTQYMVGISLAATQVTVSYGGVITPWYFLNMAT